MKLDVGPYGSDEALIIKDEGEDENGEVIGPVWHRLAGGGYGGSVSDDTWINGPAAEKLAKDRGLPLYYV